MRMFNSTHYNFLSLQHSNVYAIDGCKDHEQLSGRPTSLGETLVLSPIHCLIAFIVLKSRCTLVYTPCCQLPFSMQVYPQTLSRCALL